MTGSEPSARQGETETRRPAARETPPVPARDSPGADASDRFRQDDRERKLDPRIVLVWRVTIGVSVAVPLVVGTVLAIVFLGPLGGLVPLGGAALLALLAGWYPRARYERWRWQLTPLALELRHGIVVRQHEAIPYFRIQQIDITRNPFDRLLDLANLEVTTASASGSATIPGIAAADAPVVRAELIARAAAVVVRHQGEISDAV